GLSRTGAQRIDSATRPHVAAGGKGPGHGDGAAITVRGRDRRAVHLPAGRRLSAGGSRTAQASPRWVPRGSPESSACEASESESAWASFGGGSGVRSSAFRDRKSVV